MPLAIGVALVAVISAALIVRGLLRGRPLRPHPARIDAFAPKKSAPAAMGGHGPAYPDRPPATFRAREVARTFSDPDKRGAFGASTRSTVELRPLGARAEDTPADIGPATAEAPINAGASSPPSHLWRDS